MDYSKYYLKNYLKNLNGEERREEGNSVGDLPDGERSRSFESEEQNFDREVEIEVTPQLTGMVQTNYRVDDYESPIIDIIPQSYDRYGARRKGWLMTLAIITCVLLTVVVGDFATGGALLAGIGGAKQDKAMPTVSYYAVVLKTCDSYSVARMYAEQQRLRGGAGFILKENEKYALVGDIYDDLGDANSVVEDNEGSRIVNIEIKEVDFDTLFEGSSQLLKSMGGYSGSIVTQLAVVADELSGSEIDKAKALEKIEGIKENLKMQYDELSAEVGENKNVALLVADVNATLGILENLLNSSVSRPNLVCDIRYSKVQIIVNYRQLVSTLSN